MPAFFRTVAVAMLARQYKREIPAGQSIEQRIVREISEWPNVTVAPHRFGGVEFRVGRREELGHLHGSRWADFRRFPCASAMGAYSAVGTR